MGTRGSKRSRAIALAAAAEEAGRPRALMKLSFGLLTAAALIVASASAFAEPADPGESAASRAVIEKQLEAFSRDAWDDAFAYAGPGVRGVFKTPERFAEMVQGGYAMVWRPKSVEFLDAEALEGGVLQRLRVVDQADEAYRLEYFLRRVGEEWRIEGVRYEREAPLAA